MYTNFFETMRDFFIVLLILKKIIVKGAIPVPDLGGRRSREPCER